MDRPQAYVTNLELRESNPDGTEGAGLSHRAGGMVLLHVLELAAYGEPRGCVTVLHDAGDHGGRYEELAHVLAADGWAIALPDLRGHGRSEGPRGHSWGLPEVVRDVEAILDHLAYRLPNEPQVLVGQGLGATYALAHALERPGRVAALVACSPLLAPRFRLPERRTGLAALFKKVGPTTEGTLGWTPEDRTTDPSALTSLASDPQVHDVATVRLGETATAAADRVRDGITTLRTPTLVLHGTDDPIASIDDSRRLASEGATVELRELPGKRHDLLHEQGAAEVMELVRTWVGEKVPRG